MVELDVKITSGDLYDFLLRLQQCVRTSGSSDWSFGRDRGYLETVLDLSDSWRGDSVISPMDTLYQEQTAGSKQSGLQGTAALCVG